MKYQLYKTKTLLDVPSNELFSYPFTKDDMENRYFYDPEIDTDFESIEVWEYAGDYDEDTYEITGLND